MRRVGFALFTILLLTGCRGDSSANTTASKKAAAAVVDEPDVDDAVAALDATIYPLVLVASPAMAEAAAAAHAQSTLLDERCAFLPMAPALTSRRPEGLGCPRQPEDRVGAE